MWWQQSLWKIPPNYDGLIYWMKQMVDHASSELRAPFASPLSKSPSIRAIWFVT
jgi:hypothetical protein